ncbi:unnamed protein product [Ectocarpus sp. CCAP 1310/34]|nr:unnamed protein product [Ectocarpus sp. CCAP 1310/34]
MAFYALQIWGLLTSRASGKVHSRVNEEEDAPPPPTSPRSALLPQQRHTREGDTKDKGDPVPSPATPSSLLPRQQEELEGDGKQEDYQVPTASTPPVVLPQQQEEGEGDEEEEGVPIDEGDENEEDVPVPLGSPNQREEVVRERVRSPERASLSPEKTEEVDRLFTAQLSSHAGLNSLVRENPEALEDIQRVIQSTVVRSFYPDDKHSDMDGRRKLATLVTMSTALGEVAVSPVRGTIPSACTSNGLTSFSVRNWCRIWNVLRHTEDMDVQRKEMALPLFLKAYCTVVRSGLCQAYLASSVIDSDWVSMSKTGGMGKVGAALGSKSAGAAVKLMSRAVPVVGGLPELAGKALEAGDHFFQTRRLVKRFFPRAIRSAASSSAPMEVIVRSPADLAAAHDDGLPSMTDFAVIQAELAALKAAKDKQQAELEELQAAKDKQHEDLEKKQAKIEAVESRNEHIRRCSTHWRCRERARTAQAAHTKGRHCLQKCLWDDIFESTFLHVSVGCWHSLRCGAID